MTIKEKYAIKMKSGKIRKLVRKTKKVGFSLFSGKGARELMFVEECAWDYDLSNN